MKAIVLTAALIFLATPALAKEYIIKEVSDPAADKPYYFSPDKLTIQPGDTVTFVDAEDDTHDVMFVNVPKAVNEMIMSPMLEKEGDKWSYTFTDPGTYQFHCHPHEALHMEGTLIVGQPSKAGETKIMDHHKLAQNVAKASLNFASSDLPQGTGTISEVDVEKRTVRINHDPIKSLGWPKMKMTFTVEPTVDLSELTSGDKVTFTTKAGTNDDYTIVALTKRQ